MAAATTTLATVDLGKAILVLAMRMAENSGGLIRLACQEEDAGAAPNPGAGHFLKFCGRRQGRDIEAYQALSREQGWRATLPDFAIEVVLPLRDLVPASYRAAADHLLALGSMIYGPDMIADWVAVFDDPAPTQVQA